MATKKKTKKNQSKKKATARKKLAKKPAPKKATPKKAALQSKPAAKKVAARPLSKNVARAKTATAPRGRVREKSELIDAVTFEPAGLGARSAGQSGDLQGLSNAGRANSESVDELLEEGNSFEAEVVKGVEDAGDADEDEVHTHEVPEDNVPGEYLDKD
jgi:hypothetical protein